MATLSEKVTTLLVDVGSLTTSMTQRFETIQSELIRKDAHIERLYEEIRELRSRMDKQEGASQGRSALWAFVVAGVSLVAALVGIYLAMQGAS